MTSPTRTWSARAAAAAAGLALLGGAAGFGVGVALRPTEVVAGPAEPVEARGRPVEPERPYSPDIDYPPLQPGLDYRTRIFGAGEFRWRYAVPKGWTATQIAYGELRWRPPDQPEVGGYSVRVKVVSTHQTVEEMVEAKLEALRVLGYEDVEVQVHTEDSLGFTYREATRNVKRYNTFRWFPLPGSDEAGFELSVVGRERDLPGLTHLLATVTSRVQKL